VTRAHCPGPILSPCEKPTTRIHGAPRAGALAASNPVLKLTFRCPAAEASCAYQARLRASPPRRAGASGKPKRLTLGSVSRRVKGGAKVTAKLKLNRTGRSLLRRSATIKATPTVSVKDAAGNGRSRDVKLTLKRKRSASR
jgi:hypothetical protein